MSKFRIFEKSPIFKKSNLTFKNFLKIEKKNFLNFLFFHLVVYSLRFPKWVYLSKSFKKFRSYIFICKSSHIFSIADLGLLSYSYASMCTGVLALLQAGSSQCEFYWNSENLHWDGGNSIKHSVMTLLPPFQRGFGIDFCFGEILRS